MSWARFDDRYYDNPKVVRAGAWGMRLHMSSIIWMASCWERQQGVIPRGALTLLLARARIPATQAKNAVAALVAEELWHEIPSAKRTKSAENAWTLHDWSAYLRPEDRERLAHVGAPPVPVPVPQKNESNDSSPSTGENLSLLTQEETRRVDLDLQVFIVWQESANKPQAKFLPKRKKLIKERRKEGYTQDDLLDAVRGWENDDWDRRKYRNAIEDLISSGPNLERFRDFWRNGRPVPQMAKPSGASARSAVYRNIADTLDGKKQIKEA